MFEYKPSSIHVIQWPPDRVKSEIVNLPVIVKDTLSVKLGSFSSLRMNFRLERRTNNFAVIGGHCTKKAIKNIGK